MAHRMGAKAWEARTALSLARLLVRQERRHEARSILAKIYGMFTEGFDTSDLKEAEELLDELSDDPQVRAHRLRTRLVAR